MMSSSCFVRTALAALAFSLFLANTAIAQDQSCTIRKLPVSFRDARSLPIQVPVADLEAKVHGKPAKILSLAPDPRPHRLVVILDASGSMGSPLEGGPPVWNLGLSLARNFYDVNRSRAQIALLF